MGSPDTVTTLPTLRMTLFKALFLPALAVIARAAPTEVVAGRVVTHAVPSLTALHHVRTVPATHALHAVHAVPAVPAVHAVHAVTPAVTELRLVEQEKPEVPTQYNFGYSITDSVTGDSKSRQESRDGDAVSGSYSVADPDGRIRTVTYTADAVHGFQATVTYDGEEGPVAIPFNTPSTSTVAVRTEPAQEASLVDTAVRTAPGVQDVHTVENLGNAVTAVRTVPTVHNVHAVHNLANAVTAVRTVPTVQDVHAVHNIGNAVTAVRTIPTVQDVHAVHNLGNAVTAVRTVPTVQDVHAVHNIGNAVTAVRTVPTIQDVHAVHNLGHAVTALRAVPSVQSIDAGHNLLNGVSAVRTVPTLQTVQGFPLILGNSNLGTQLDLSQFRFVNAGRVV